MRRIVGGIFSLLLASAVVAGEAAPSVAPSVGVSGGKAAISFTVAAPTDVEVAILDAEGKVVRHLAAGALGARSGPPAPLQPGLAQRLEWDFKDDLGKPVPDGPLKVRVRTGTRVRLGRFLGGDACRFGKPDSLAADEDGNIYILGYEGNHNQNFKTVRVFAPDGRFLRTVLPLPADLKPEAAKDVAAWDEARRAFHPRNLASTNPEFYASTLLHVVSASRARGILLTDGEAIYALDGRGGVPGETFRVQPLWPKDGRLPNSGGGPVFLAESPDGMWLYLSGPYSSRTRYGHVADPRVPPGRLYRMKRGPGETMHEFATLPVAPGRDAESGHWTGLPDHYTVPRGPVHQVAVDAKGNVYVADRENGRVAIFDDDGKPIDEIPVKFPDLVAVHPTTGAVYVMQKDCVGYHKFGKRLLKFEGVDKRAVPVEGHQFAEEGNWPAMVLSTSGGRTRVWVTGVNGGLAVLEDAGEEFREVETAFRPRPEAQTMFARLAADPLREEVYASDAGNRIWRYDGTSGREELLQRGGKPLAAVDLVVGWDGLLYVRTGEGFSGPLERLTRDMEPAPYPATGTHVLSPYIYSRYGVGNCEKGLGVGPDGRVYISFMYEWAKYLVSGFGPDGRPLKGAYLEGRMRPDHYKAGMPKDLTSAIIGPIPDACGGIRVDRDGNIYVGLRVLPRDLAAPEPFGKDPAWANFTGCVVKFAPAGGTVAGIPDGPEAAADPGALATKGKAVIQGALAAYPGIAPFSGGGYGGNTSGCVCRVPRFDLDRYGRLVFPNAVASAVTLMDGAGNVILEFGAYGNFDSQFVPPDANDARPLVAVPEIPLGWPTGAAITERYIYVCDTYNRRIVRVDLGYATEATGDVR